MKHLDRLLYLSAALVLLAGCYPSELIKQAPTAVPDLISGAAAVAATGGASIPAWLQVGGAIAILIAAGVGGPATVAKVKKMLGRTDSDGTPPPTIPLLPQ
jgi:hypothetical protein